KKMMRSPGFNTTFFSAKSSFAAAPRDAANQRLTGRASQRNANMVQFLQESERPKINVVALAPVVNALRPVDVASRQATATNRERMGPRQVVTAFWSGTELVIDDEGNRVYFDRTPTGARLIFEGPTDTEAFATFVEQILA